MDRSQKAGAIVALDQEKAYDKILHPYLWAVLEKFGMPANFIKTIQALYTNAKTTVKINGELSKPFTICRGVRQGDALSCLLFDIAIEPLAASIRRAPEIRGILIPGTRGSLKIKLFANDGTVYLSKEDRMEDLQNILTRWCRVSGAKFNIEKTEIIPLGNVAQRNEIIASRRLNEGNTVIPQHIHIAKDGEPVRILGTWLGNNVDQAVTWAPILEDCCKRLKRWGAAKHSLEGRRLIIQMQVAGVTQYLTKVQGMPLEAENELNKMIRRFMWNNEKMDTVNRMRMFTEHKKGGKKLLDIEARNKAIHLTWLKAYLNLGENRATWTYFADAMIKDDIPPSHRIDGDAESRVMPIIQSWEPWSKGSLLPEGLKMMLKLAKEHSVQISATSPTRDVQIELPIWYHTQSKPSARKLYKTKSAKCLRRKHGIRLVKDALLVLDQVSEEHVPANNCGCENCRRMRTTEKCPHPHECIELTAALIQKILPRWNPTEEREQTPLDQDGGEIDPNDTEVTFITENDTTELRNAITIFGETPTMSQEAGASPPRNPEGAPMAVIYTDGACINNGREDARAGSGAWYGENDPRNISVRVAHSEQSNQTGELVAILLVVKAHPPEEDLCIVSDSKYAIDGLTKNVREWEDKDWLNIQHRDIFKSITAWMRWRKGKTKMKWVKGHNGTRGNEEADKLAGEGAAMPTPEEPLDLSHPPNQLAAGAKIAKLEQRDFYKILNRKRKIPQRKRTERLVGTVQACAQDTFAKAPTVGNVWTATRHKDFTRKTRDFLWKSTQNAYKIGEHWAPIEGFEQRGICPICEVQEDMDHILTACEARPRETAWRLANELWGKRNSEPLPTRLGDIIGYGLAEFTKNGKPDKGKNRLYRIIVSETAYLIWKMRNERRIRDGDSPENGSTESETFNRWTHALNKRLTIDCALTNDRRFGKHSINKRLVKRTWEGCLKNEESLPPNWYQLKGVLVGISSTRPPGRNR